ncbi:hypothetical protein G6677_09230, partial [Polynucleobacter paneuropaeus]|nr:hypothetical protein [Polynucleobacter paneuropaeus]
ASLATKYKADASLEVSAAAVLTSAATATGLSANTSTASTNSTHAASDTTLASTAISLTTSEAATAQSDAVRVANTSAYNAALSTYSTAANTVSADAASYSTAQATASTALSVANSTANANKGSLAIVAISTAASLATKYQVDASAEVRAAAALSTAASTTGVSANISTASAGTTHAANDQSRALSVAPYASLGNGNVPTIILSTADFLNDQNILVAMAANQISGLPKFHIQLAADQTMTAAQAAQISLALNENFIANSVVVKDSAVNIQKYANQLEALTIDPPLGSIVLTDSGPVTLNFGIENSNLFGLINTQNGTPFTITVSGVAAADVSILLSNSLITSVSVSDVASNIQSYWGQLETANAAHQLNGINVSNGASISIGTDAASINLASLITNASQIVVNLGYIYIDTAGIGLVESTLGNGSIPIQFSFANGYLIDWDTAPDLVVINDVLNAHPSWAVSDVRWVGNPINVLKVAQELTNDKLLHALGAQLQVNVVQQNVTAAQSLDYYESKFFNALHISINGQLIDSASNIQANLDQLTAYTNYVKNTPIQLTDNLPPTITISATQASHDGGVLNAIQSSYLLSIVDTAVNLNNLNVSGLNAQYIELTPTTLDPTNPLVVTSSNIVDVNLTQLTGMASADVHYQETAINNGAGTELTITDGTNTYKIDLTNVSKANLAVYDYVDPRISVQNITTTAAELATNIAYYEDLAKAGKLGSIALSDIGAPNISLTNSQVIAESNLFSLITTPFTITVSGVAAADVSILLSNSLITSVSVSDVASNIQSYWGQLETANAAHQLNGINVSNGASISIGTDAASINLASLITNASQIVVNLGYIYIDTAGIGLVESTLGNGSIPIQFSFANGYLIDWDTAPDLVVINDVLNAHPSWAVSDVRWVGNPINVLKVAQELTNDKLLHALGAQLQVNVVQQNVTAAQSLDYYESKFFNALHISINGQLIDSASNIQANLDQLTAYTNYVKNTPIQLTDNLPPTITISATQASHDGGVLNAIQSSYLLSIVDTAVNLNNLNVSGLNAQYIELTPTTLDPTNPLVVTSSNIVDVNLTQLTGMASADVHYQETAINNGAGTELTITDGTNTYKIDLTNVSKANLAVYDYVDPRISVQNITTTAAELATNIAYYEDLAKAGKLGSIALSDPNNFSPITSVLGLAEYQKVLALLQAPSSISDAYASFNAGTLTNSVLIDATSASIMANLANLASMSAAGYISGIVVRDASTLTSILNVGADGVLAADNARMLGAAGITQCSVATGSIALSSVEVAALAKAGITFQGEYSISIADTAVNIATNIDVIQNDIAASIPISVVEVTNNQPLIITQQQLMRNADALKLLLKSNPDEKFIISNASIGSGTGFILLYGGYNKTLFDHTYYGGGGKLHYYLIQAGIEQALVALNDPYVNGIQIIYDTGKNIGGQLSFLNSHSNFWAYYPTSVINLTESDFFNYQSVLIKNMPGTVVFLDVSEVLVADLPSIISDNRVIHISLASNSFITEDEYQALSSRGMLRIGDGDNFTIANVLATDIVQIVNDQIAKKINVIDTSANISSHLDLIQAVTSNGSLVFSDITVTDTNPITLAESQLSSDAGALALLSGSYVLAVTNALAGDAVSILNAHSHVTSISIVDSSIHLAANLDALELVNSSISSIVVTDPNALSLTSQELTNDSSILAKVNGLFDGSSGSVTFNLSPNVFGPVSASHMDAITNWNGSDTISYSTLLTIGGSATSPIAGQAQINQTTGIASFNASDSTLAQQISAIEHSLATTGALAGQFAEWVNGGNTYVLITDGHAGVVNPTTGIEAGDVLIKLVGISDPSHVALSQGALIAH